MKMNTHVSDIKARAEAATLNEEETDQLRRNFVERLKEPMRSDFRRVVNTIDALRAELKTAKETLAAVRLWRERNETDQGCPDFADWPGLDQALGD